MCYIASLIIHTKIANLKMKSKIVMGAGGRQAAGKQSAAAELLECDKKL